MSRGTIFSAVGSTMMRARSTDCMPSFSESASRSVASETKPSCTSRRPTGTCDLVCSSSAMRSWSSVRMPWSMRIWPMWRLACGFVGEFIADLLVAELRGAAARSGDIEARAALLRQRDGALVVLERQALLAQVVEADGEVVGEVGVVRVGGEGLEVLLLRLGPAALLRELVAEGEVEHVRRRVCGQHGLHAAFGRYRVDARAAQRDQPGLRMRIARIGLQQPQVGRLRGLE